MKHDFKGYLRVTGTKKHEHPWAIEEESVDTLSCRRGKHRSIERERRKILVLVYVILGETVGILV
jgi:hypothetical protein